MRKQLFEIEPDVLRLDDPRIEAYRRGAIDDAELMRLARPEDPFQIIAGRMHYFTEAERKRQIDGFVANHRNQMSKYGGLHPSRIRDIKEHIVEVYPEVADDIARVEADIVKEACQGCAANQKYHPVLDKIMRLPKDRDVEPLRSLIPAQALKLLKGEALTEEDLQVEPPVYIKKIDIPFIDGKTASRDFDPSLDNVERKACWDCVKKHLSEAMILMSECLLGYGSDKHLQKWEAIAHLSQASKECSAVDKPLADRIRALRMKIMRQKPSPENVDA